jgi:PadR family transcriptional regulator, regulatory protein PadR
MQGDAIKGHLDALLLAVVADGPVHGYAVVQRLAERSGGGFALPEGTVYPALHRLEADGLLRSRWSKAEGRRRREYELTAAGRARLGERTVQWRDFAAAVERVLGSVPARRAGAAR